MEAYAREIGIEGRLPFGRGSTPEGGGPRGGRGFRSGSGVFIALTIMQILVEAYFQKHDAETLGYHTNFAGHLVFDNLAKAAGSLGEGAKVLIDDPSRFGDKPALFVVHNGQFVGADSRCVGCVLVQDKDGAVKIGGPMM